MGVDVGGVGGGGGGVKVVVVKSECVVYSLIQNYSRVP